MATFVLVSGAWHAGWCWQRIVPLLEAAGHRALAPDLVGMGPDAANFADASLAVWADQIARLVASQPEPVILVGHSRGGVVISETAERVPGHIARLVYLTAFLCEDGHSINSTHAKLSGADGAADARAATLRLGENGAVYVQDEAIAPQFYNTTDPEWAAIATASLTGEPASSLSEVLSLSAERFGSVPRGYIECLQDRAVPIDLQRAMRRALPCDRIETLDTDHSPFFSDPAALVRALGAMAA